MYFKQILVVIRPCCVLCVASAALQILMNTGSTLKEKFPDTCEHLLQTLQSMVKIGTSRQAKHAVRCLANMFDNKEELFDQIAVVSRII